MVSGNDAIKYKDKFKEFSGTWNPTLKGLIFPETKKDIINELLSEKDEE